MMASFTRLTNEKGLSFRTVRSIIEDKAGNIWFGGADGLSRYDGKSLTTLLTNFVGFVFEDRAGNLWCSIGGSAETASALGIDDSTVYRYIGLFNESVSIDASLQLHYC